MTFARSASGRACLRDGEEARPLALARVGAGGSRASARVRRRPLRRASVTVSGACLPATSGRGARDDGVADGGHREEGERAGERHDDGARRDVLRADGAADDLQHGRDLHERREAHEDERQERDERQRDDQRQRPSEEIVLGPHVPVSFVPASARPGPRMLPAGPPRRACRARGRGRRRTRTAGGDGQREVRGGHLPELRQPRFAHAEHEDLLGDPHEHDGAPRVERPAVRRGRARPSGARRRRAARRRAARTPAADTASSVRNVSSDVAAVRAQGLPSVHRRGCRRTNVRPQKPRTAAGRQGLSSVARGGSAAGRH